MRTSSARGAERSRRGERDDGGGPRFARGLLWGLAISLPVWAAIIALVVWLT